MAWLPGVGEGKVYTPVKPLALHFWAVLYGGGGGGMGALPVLAPGTFSRWSWKLEAVTHSP